MLDLEALARCLKATAYRDILATNLVEKRKPAQQANRFVRQDKVANPSDTGEEAEIQGPMVMKGITITLRNRRAHDGWSGP
jgi:hypothetical protein